MSEIRPGIPLFLLGVFATLAVVLGVVVLNRDDDSGAAATSAPAAPDTTAAVVTTAAGTAPTTISPTPATVPPTSLPTTRCAGRAPMVFPAGVELQGGNGNFDGPPEPESVMDSDGGFVFVSGGTWYVGFSLNDGYVVFEPLPAPLDPGFVPEATVWDFGAHDDGLLVKIDRSLASGAEVYAFYYLDADCAVEDAGTAGTERYEFLDWFGAAHTQAFSCTADGVFETSAGQGSGSMWDVRDVYFEWTAPDGPGFIFQFEDGMEVPAGDPAIAEAGTVHC